MPSPLLAPPPPAAADDVRRLLLDCDYPAAAAVVATDEVLPEGDAGALLRLFAFDLAVPAEEVPGADLLTGAGLVQEVDGWLVPSARLAAVEGVLVFGDPARVADAPEFVAPASATSRTVVCLTDRRPVRRSLDLCTGSGVLALLLARHSDHVVATDVSSRALAWAAFNAALNLARVELRQGSLVDPVAGERFDLVSANPPYVVGLGGELVYRDSPLPGDGVSEAVVRALPSLLAPDGRAVTTLSWTGSPDRPRTWLQGSGCDAWLLTGRRQGVREHALAWVGSDGEPLERGRRVAAWAAGLRDAGTSTVSEGAVLVRPGQGRWREDQARLPLTTPVGERAEQAFTARCQPVGDDPVLALAPGVRLVDDAGTHVVRWGGALSDVRVGDATGRVLRAVDGRRRLSALLPEVAAASAAGAADIVDGVRAAVRELVDSSVLEVRDELPPVAVPRQAEAPRIDPSDGPRLAAALAAAGYRADAVAELLGTDPTLLLKAADLPLYPLRTPPTGLGALVRLLLLGLPVTAADLPADLATPLLHAGLARRDGERLAPTAQLVPHDRHLVASDLLAAKQRPDVVVGVQPPTRTLADLTPRLAVDRALDVGTGCGFQAVLLAEHARHVVATDVNPRALAFAAANAALAGVEVDLRQGAWFEPVAGEAFDLVVTNPPYVLSPDSRWTFRDAGLPRDAASRLVSEHLPTALAPGGVGVALLSWIDVPDQPPPPLQWSAGQGCDGVLLATGAADAWQTATAWNSDERDPERYAAEVARWLEWMQDEQIAAVEYGALVLRRSGGGSARRIGLPGRPRGAAGEQVLRLLEPAHDLDPDAVLLPAPDVVLEQQVRSGAAGWSGAETALRQERGLQLATSVSDAAGEVLGRLVPGRTLRQAAGDESRLGQVLPELHRLLAAGLLVRAVGQTAR